MVLYEKMLNLNPSLLQQFECVLTFCFVSFIINSSAGLQRGSLSAQCAWQCVWCGENDTGFGPSMICQGLCNLLWQATTEVNQLTGLSTKNWILHHYSERLQSQCPTDSAALPQVIKLYDIKDYSFGSPHLGVGCKLSQIQDSRAERESGGEVFSDATWLCGFLKEIITQNVKTVANIKNSKIVFL